MSLIYDRDEYEQYLCPLLAGELAWDEAGEQQTRSTKRCHAPLHLVFEGTVAVTDELRLFTPDEKSWNTSGWRVECENRHVLLTSAGEEIAEPFDVEFLFSLAQQESETWENRTKDEGDDDLRYHYSV